VRLLALTAVISFAAKLDPARIYVLIALPTTGDPHLLLRYAADNACTGCAPRVDACTR
jgi:hypothetical protein